MSQRDRMRLPMEEPARHQEQQSQEEVGPIHDTPQQSQTRQSPADAILNMQHTHGNQAVQRMLRQVQRVPFEHGGELDENLSNQINTKRGSGGQLDNRVANSMSQSMGYDFSGVNVHTDSHADQISRAIGAKAFTTGSDIFFKSGEYSPGSSSGQQLLAHELTHVVQQGGRAPSGNLSVGPANDSYESEADSMASSLGTSDAVQRQNVPVEDEEEMIQTKRDDIQRQDIPEEEEMPPAQLKRDDIQRQDIPEDEEQ